MESEEKPVQVAYLLTYPDLIDGYQHPMILRFSTLNEAYHFVTDEKLDKFKIEKVIKTLVAER